MEYEMGFLGFVYHDDDEYKLPIEMETHRNGK